MKKLVASLLLAVGLTVTAAPASACGGYWDCQPYEFVIVCEWYPG